MGVLPILLLAIGAALLCAEMFMPGFGVCGITGVVLIIISSVITVLTVPYGIFIVLGEVGLVGVTMTMAFNYIRKRQLYGKLILDETLNYEEKEIGDLDFFMGKEGVAKTALRPFGSVDFNGVAIEVCSDGTYIPEATKVRVVSVSNQKIVVKQAQ
jgi:membrane-bound ClpP family serine protease